MSEGIRLVVGVAVAILVAGLLTYLLLRAMLSQWQQHTDLPAEDAMERGRCMECREWRYLNQLVLTGGVCLSCWSRRGSANQFGRM
ncbi:hypothetical protein [Mycobacterium sp. 3519A]|uniref:hypothetical protein n=1 Tax=Mycobacterium sp. 3519A TaxID=2057184 RepID=UPI000C7B0069|nr:hypothetical protein [Mycobacterium sp. 3519A]